MRCVGVYIVVWVGMFSDTAVFGSAFCLVGIRSVVGDSGIAYVWLRSVVRLRSVIRAKPN